ncbi:MAG: single-stranded DNA-binding protein [Anaerolineae bacterium]|jgi:single-strand DNA-binding protein|nr:single-stranded DNA-binding protein [Anaerolineae bacterium]MBT7074051.1 single-stranded DNA-binding protein [Anaerolineae bacterium]
MSRGLNKVMIIGNLGRDPEMRYTPSGRPVTTFSVAVSRSWKSPNGEARSETEWFKVVSWGKLAEICNEFLKKGQQVYIEGRLKTRQWEDKEGQKRSTVELIANEMTMLGERRTKIQQEENSVIEDTPPDVDEDEFPF